MWHWHLVFIQPFCLLSILSLLSPLPFIPVVTERTTLIAVGFNFAALEPINHSDAWSIFMLLNKRSGIFSSAACFTSD